MNNNLSDTLSEDNSALMGAIAQIRRATKDGDVWTGSDFSNQQDAYDPSEVDEAIAEILNAVVSGRLVTVSFKNIQDEQLAQSLNYLIDAVYCKLSWSEIVRRVNLLVKNLG